MAFRKSVAYAVDLSPPLERPNVSKANSSKIEVLLLQPFSRAPQLYFEDVPVGTEASQLVMVRSVYDTPSTVVINRVPRDKGFAVDPHIFKLAPGAEQLVHFLWTPVDSNASCRATVSVCSDRGYKGMLILLATVKQSARKAPRHPQKPHTQTPARTQQSKVPAPSGCKETAPPKTRRNITIPVQFISRTEMRYKSKVNRTGASPAALSAPQPKVQVISTFTGKPLQCQETSFSNTAVVADPTGTIGCVEHTVKSQSSQQVDQETFICNPVADGSGATDSGEPTFASQPSQQIRKETFICNTAMAVDPAGTMGSGEEFEDSLNAPASATVDSENDLDSSLNTGHASVVNKGTESYTLSSSTPHTQNRDGNAIYREDSFPNTLNRDRTASYREDSLNSSSSFNFSARMQALYEEVIKMQGPDDSLESPIDDEFSIRMQDRYEKALAKQQSLRIHPVEAGCKGTKMQDAMQSKPMFPELEHVAAELDRELDLGGGAGDIRDNSFYHSWKYVSDDDPLPFGNFFPANVSSIHEPSTML
ncbi:unnamed protein product [Ixodes hexagonus]